jgi:HPt (histidine-containing phosphotransfer) domain-containing protein
VYASLLKRFLEINSNLEEKTLQIVNGTDASEMILFFHSLKGSTGNLSANKMYVKASILEKLARNGDIEALKSELNVFFESFQELKKAIAEIE